MNQRSRLRGTLWIKDHVSGSTTCGSPSSTHTHGGTQAVPLPPVVPSVLHVYLQIKLNNQWHLAIFHMVRQLECAVEAGLFLCNYLTILQDLVPGECACFLCKALISFCFSVIYYAHFPFSQNGSIELQCHFFLGVLVKKAAKKASHGNLRRETYSPC